MCCGKREYSLLFLRRQRQCWDSWWMTQSGAIAAHYEYDPFGKLMNFASEEALWNSYRFSTTYYVDGTELHYYGTRYYLLDMSRCLNRDSILEAGGLNLHGFVQNRSINAIDAIGHALYAFDGTANVPENETNVYLSFRAWGGRKGNYLLGIGNEIEYSIYTQKLRQATGWVLSETRSRMLIKLEQNIEANDLEIDVIGFSRGAVTAIAFAEVIEKLREEGVYPYGRIEKISFMGLYDPVPEPAIGHRPRIAELAENTAIAYSLDEKRSEFEPSLYTESIRIEARRFRGGHSDIGGGYQERGLASFCRKCKKVL